MRCMGDLQSRVFGVHTREGDGFICRYELDAEKGFRQVVYFMAIRIAPVSADAEALSKWLSVFKAANPTMVRSMPVPISSVTHLVIESWGALRLNRS